jgi:hypothetical protein
MTRIRVFAFAFAVLLSFTLAGQGRPTDPGGGGSSPIATPQVVVDASGVTVGEVIKLEANGLARASIKYALPTGDFVVLSAAASGLTHFGVAQLLANSAMTARVFFKEADCSGDAWLLFGFGGTEQLTRRQAIIFSNIVLPPPPPGPVVGSCSPIGTTNWLFTADTASCAVLADQNSPITFAAYYGTNFNFPPGGFPSNCSPIAGGLTIPSAAYPIGGAAFAVYTRGDELLSKFRLPLHIE